MTVFVSDEEGPLILAGLKAIREQEGSNEYLDKRIKLWTKRVNEQIRVNISTARRNALKSISETKMKKVIGKGE